MNKYLIAGALVVFIGSVFYFTKTNDSATANQTSQPSVATPETAQTINTSPIMQNTETINSVSSSARSSSASQTNESPIEMAATEQTQNAVDFNAPGAGTAQQKANAATAATKAYQEAKQRSQ